MIEAVNSVVSNAPLIRVAADQVAASRSFAGDAAAVESVARGPVAPYISPYISVDPFLDAAVLQLRDSDTGDVIEQFPSDQAIERMRQAKAETRALVDPDRSGGGQTAEAASAPVASPSGFSVALAQEAQVEAAPSAGAGLAQAAITALSAGAQAGQGGGPTISVTA